MLIAYHVKLKNVELSSTFLEKEAKTLVLSIISRVFAVILRRVASEKKPTFQLQLQDHAEGNGKLCQ